jgi:uncharacterized protein YndB with AHSA1/START domain
MSSIEPDTASGGVAQLPSGPDRLVLTIVLPHLDPAAAFACWTEPERICRWWSQAAAITPAPGGAYHLSWPAMNWHLRGHYTIFDPGRALTFTWRWDHDPPDHPERTVTLVFAPHPAGGTRLTLIHGPYTTMPADQEERIEHHLTGWQHFLPRLAALS